MLSLRPARCRYVLHTFVVALSLFALATASANAQMTFPAPPATPTATDHLWSGAISTDWNTAGNWEKGGVPVEDCVVGIVPVDNPCVINTTIGVWGSSSLVVTGGYGSASNYPLRIITGGQLGIQNTFVGTNGDGQMLIDEGGLLGSTYLVIGGDINDSAADADSGYLNVYGELQSQYVYVGNTGTGELTMGPGSTLNTVGSVIGYAAGSTGTMNLNGVVSAPASYAGSFMVGRAGNGTLNVTNATLDGASGWVVLGTESTGTGTLVVDNGTLAAGMFTVGESGTGTATVRNGSTLDLSRSAYGVILGENSGSSGVLTLTGSGTTASAGLCTVGKAGSGLLEVTNGATLGKAGSQSHIQLGAAAGGAGELMVDGSTVRNATIYVGQGGSTADVVFQNGATLDGATMLVGSSGTTGTLSIDNSTWASDASNSLLIIGNGSSAGTAIISNGSTVDIDGSQNSGTGAVMLGGSAGSVGLLHVRDAGTTLTARALSIGASSANSTAELYVYDDASMTVTDSFYLQHTTGTTPHEIQVSTGGSLTASGNFFWGSGGTATNIDILSGGRITLHQTSDVAMMVQNASITIDGLGSQLRYDTDGVTLSTPLAFGSMPVTVSNGGTLSVSELYAMNTALTVTGSGSVFRSDSDLTITSNAKVENFVASAGAIVAAENIFFVNDMPQVDTVGLHLLTGEDTRLETGHLSVLGGQDELNRLKIEDGASTLAVSGSIGSAVNSGDAMAEVLVTGSGSEMIFTDTLEVGRFYREDRMNSMDLPGRGHLRIKDGALVQAKTVSLEYATPTTPLVRLGTINLNGGELRMETLNDDLSDPGLNWMAGTLHFTGSTALSSASSWEDDLTLGPDQTLVTDGELKINSGGSLTVAGGSADLTGLNNLLATPIDLQYGSVRIHDGYLRWDTLDTFTPYSSLVVDGAGGTAALTFDNITLDPLQKPFLTATIGTSGNASWTVSNGTAFSLAGTLDIGPGGTVIVDQATVQTGALLGSGQIDLTDPASGPALTVGGGSYSGSISGTGSLRKTTSSTLTLSGPLSYTGDTTIGGGTLAVESDLTGSGGEIVINAGGTLKPGAVNLGGHAVSGTGTLTLTGNATLGDGSLNAGFAFDGTLNVGSHVLTLEDNNRAFLGRTVNLDGGTINAPNGVRLNPVNSLNTSYVLNATGPSMINAEFRNNGVVHGPASGDWLVLAGDVSGAGSYDGQVAFTGSFAPGNSPAIVDVENVMFSAGNTLTMEIGGLLAGSDYDQLNVSGLATLGGTLELVMLNGYTLEPGEQYLLIDGPVSGEFDSIVGLPAGWDLRYDTGGVSVTPEPTTLGLLGLGGLALLRRRRR